MPNNTVAEVFATYRERIFKFIRSRVGKIEDAEDILQDVFYQFAGVEDPVEQAAAWLYRAARNRIIDGYRKKKDESLPTIYNEDADDAEEYIFGEIAAIIYGEDATPETELLRTLVLDEIESAINELTPNMRDIFIKTELLNMSVKEISRECGVSVNTLLSRKHYAIIHLRKRLQDLYADFLGR